MVNNLTVCTLLRHTFSQLKFGHFISTNYLSLPPESGDHLVIHRGLEAVDTTYSGKVSLTH